MNRYVIREAFLFNIFTFHGIKMPCKIDFQFDITKINKYPSRLHLADLEKCNKFEIQRQVSHADLLDRLVGEARDLIKNSFTEQ